MKTWTILFIGAIIVAMAAVASAQTSEPSATDPASVWRDYSQRMNDGSAPVDAATRSVTQQAELNERRDQREARENMSSAVQSAAGTGIGWLSWGVGTMRSLQELREAYQTLTQQDATLEPDYRPPGSPEVPSSCEGNDECGDCYRQALASLNRVRVDLERLRAIYANTKGFAGKAMAFGDSASGIHAVTGLAWQQEKRKIEKELVDFQHTYDAKYLELIPRVEDALKQIGRCEEQHFHNPDWYNRFGFIYYTFMADRYKRND